MARWLAPSALIVPLALVVCLGLAAAHTDESAPAGKGDADGVETVEVTDVTAVKQGRSIGDLLGRLHPPIVHLPIAWLVLVFVTDGFTFMLRRPWERAGLYLLAGAVAACVPAVATGLLRASHMHGGREIGELVDTHRTLALTTSGLAAAALALRLVRRNTLAGGFKWVYLALVGAATIVVSIAGHWGGKMVFGKDFMPF